MKFSSGMELSTFMTVLYLRIILKDLHFTGVFECYVTLDFNSLYNTL